MPYRIQRALSVLIIGPTVEIDVQQDVKGSDEFRRVISAEGFKRWTDSRESLLFGAGIRRFEESYFATASRFEMDPFTLIIQSAADVGAYETTLWTLLGVLGLVGLVLYAWLLLELMRSILPALRSWRLRGPDFVIVAWAVMAGIGAFFTCVLFGSYPSFEIFLAILAKGMIEDFRKEQRPATARALPSLPSITLPKPESIAT